MLQRHEKRIALSGRDWKLFCEENDPLFGALQQELRNRGIPLVLLIDGWDGAGKGGLISSLIAPLDPRGFSVHAPTKKSPDEKFRPWLWRYWLETPAAGRIAIFDRGWYDGLPDGLVDGELDLEARLSAIRDFEQLLHDSGALVIKIFLHIDAETQKKRLSELDRDPDTTWRVRKKERRRSRRYSDYALAYERILDATDCVSSPWHIVNSDNPPGAFREIRLLVQSLARQRLDCSEIPPLSPERLPEPNPGFTLDSVCFDEPMDAKRYRKKLKEAQQHLRRLEFRMYQERIPVVILYEGWDAAGKGGNIKRLTAGLDPRGYDVISIAAPTTEEKSHHYLWRFWNKLPKGGHLAVFDRTWYGRVLVERVEGFCQESDWRRAYGEINRFEDYLIQSGYVVIKFWLQIDQDEQLRRFEDRRNSEWKKWKLTDEDWRNREKFPLYNEAVEEMIRRTSTPESPWIILEANDKRHARIKALNEVIRRIEIALDAR